MFNFISHKKCIFKLFLFIFIITLFILILSFDKLYFIISEIYEKTELKSKTFLCLFQFLEDYFNLKFFSFIL